MFLIDYQPSYHSFAASALTSPTDVFGPSSNFASSFYSQPVPIVEHEHGYNYAPPSESGFPSCASFLEEYNRPDKNLSLTTGVGRRSRKSNGNIIINQSSGTSTATRAEPFDLSSFNPDVIYGRPLVDGPQNIYENGFDPTGYDSAGYPDSSSQTHSRLDSDNGHSSRTPSRFNSYLSSATSALRSAFSKSVSNLRSSVSLSDIKNKFLHPRSRSNNEDPDSSFLSELSSVESGQLQSDELLFVDDFNPDGSRRKNSCFDALSSFDRSRSMEDILSGDLSAGWSSGAGGSYARSFFF